MMDYCPGDAGSSPGSDDGGRPDETMGPAIGQDPATTEPAVRGMTILVVEDDEDTSHVLTRLLEQMGHEVVAAADGDEAWCQIERRRVDLVLSDWMMPGYNGLDLCRRIRALSGRPYTYVVVVTARGGSDDRLEALAAGADDFLAKPFDPRELVARLGIASRLLAMQEELERKNNSLRALATTDELTGLKNRRRFFEELESHFAQAARQRSPLSLVMLDVDQFKAYNDSFGHPAGDDVLRGVAEALRKSTRGHETVARHGGEEFAVLLPGSGPDVARRTAERLREAVERRPWPHQPVTASFGVATMGPGAGEARDLVDQADRALYASKRAGRNRVTHHADLKNTPEGAPWIEIPASRLSPGHTALPALTSGDVPTCDDIVDGWARALLLRDGETVEHSRRVTGMVLDLARALGVDEAEMPHVRRGALLHDIGKMGIPDSILLKPGPLTENEWALMRRHPEFAYNLLSPVAFLRPALDIPYAHHERWDGGGYPRGLAGEQIPLAARAFAAVDVWDALSHDRPYRKAWPETRVGAHVAALAGTHLDPRVVEALQRTLVSNRGPKRIVCEIPSGPLWRGLQEIRPHAPETNPPSYDGSK